MLESLRGLGYAPPTALADLVDNSIAANAGDVAVHLEWAGPESWVRIVDDGDGMDDAARNPGDNLRFAGRMSLALLEPETGWFNQGTYLGKQRVLSIGVGGDHQRLAFDTGEEDYSSWTVDLHYDQPVGAGGLTLTGSYIDIRNAPNAINFTAIAPAVEADVVSVRAGYLIPGDIGPGRLQPFGRYEWIHVDDSDDDTHVGGLGLNYFLMGHANKLSVEATYVGQQRGETSTVPLQDHLVVTVQLAAGL